MSPQTTVGEPGCEYLSRIHAVIIHGPFDDSPGEINFPLGADSVIFSSVATPITEYIIFQQATIVRNLARWNGPIGLEIP
jgi:hypothetical protein